MNLVLKTDSILERLSRSKHISLITFVLAFLEQSISPILPEAYTALVLSYRKDISWKFLSFVSACGSTFGALLTYSIGYFFYAAYGEKIIATFGWNTVFENARLLFVDNVFVAQLVASVTPLPDRIFSFVAGAFGLSLFLVLLASFLGRLTRALIVGYLAYEWGDEARNFIKKHTKAATIAITIFVVFYILYTISH
ncbi:MAG: hypothetical protein KBC21_03890 [Candidatus Pacebacteria bacterium]|jgi:membrane protein YqaA with SNARE-associated domain|nr:hypothetical protein [Candidatus Paceibacterota bacterium]